MKGQGNFGYKFLLFIALVVAIANATARGYRPFFSAFTPDEEDTTAAKDSTAKSDSARNLRFPIHDKTGNPLTDQSNPKSIDLEDPKNVQKTFEYDADSNRYYYTSKIGNEYLRNPTYLTLDEYMQYRAREDENAYFQRRFDGLMLFNKTPELPQMYKEGLFDRIFGSSTIQVKPQGNVDVTFGGNWQNIKNPTLPIRAQKYGIFDFDMQMNINLLATVGDKLKLNISNNTKATFDYQNIQKLDYNGKEDEMLKKVEAGNVSFPLKSSLINGVQSLFGLKTQLQFGKLWVTGVVSQQKSQRKSLTIQGGSQAQQIAIKANNYEENRNFLLAQYFHRNYNKALKDYPVINSLVTINKVEVWITNRTGAVSGVRDILCLMDLGESEPYLPFLSNPSSGIRNGLPDNRTNRLYSQLQINPNGRQQKSATNAAVALGLTQGQDFERTTARQLSPTEFTFNPQLGYIMLNTQMNPDDVLGVAYRYTYRGQVYQVGEFAADLPPDSTNPKVLFLKLLKGTAPRTRLPVWRLMMKNVYALGGFGVSKDQFMLNILYQDPGGGEKRYMPEGPLGGTPFISLLNLDHLNAQNEPQPDGIFDFAEGITINTQQGKIIFPVLEPFGSDLLKAVENEPVLQRRYIYQVLYDSTKFIAQQYQQNDRYIMRGTYKSSSSSDIFLGGFNIPPGSVSVSAGGTRLVENQDYSIEYGLGRIKILNTGILNSGVPINIQYEDNATFGFQQQNFMAMRLDYYENKNLTIGGTIMRLKERPFTQKVTFGDDPIQNTVLGLDVNYQKEVPAITRLVDKLPVYSSTAPSFLNTNVEVAGLLPGHPKQINALDPEGAVYIDDFEGTSSVFDLKFPAQAWSLASTPFGAVNKNGQTLFPEASLSNNTQYGMNRARLAWYMLEPTLINPGSTVPGYVMNDSNQHYIRLVATNQLFPNRTNALGAGSTNTFDLGFYPKDRGPYNFDVTNIDPNDGKLLNPEKRWGGISRSIDNTDFEASNVQYLQFWVMDPFLNQANPNGGSMYINLGNVSEDIMKDSRLFFENGISSPFDATKLDTTVWGYVPKFEQQITRAFDNDNNARKLQDVGYDGLPDVGQAGQESETRIFGKFLSSLQQKLNGGAANPAYAAASADPGNDNFLFYRDSSFSSGPNPDDISVLTRYKKFNNPDGNSPITDPNSAFATSGTAIPESEDINRDNTMNESESYFQYRIDFTRNMRVGTNNIISIQDIDAVKLPNGNSAPERWYQFKIPIQNYDRRVGGISDFRSIRFLRMFLAGWQDSVILRFATFELGRNQWRNYNYSLNTPGENLPQQNQGLTDFTVTSVSLEENAKRAPVPYVLPPGVNRQQSANPQGGQQTLLLNEQSLSLRACALQDGDARGVFKEVNVDMRQFSYLRMFLHAESMVGQPMVRNADVDAFIRIGSDFINNYYEYRTPLTITPDGASNPETIWPATNNVNIKLQELVDAKKERDSRGWPTHVPYETKDSKGNTIVIIGNPNIGGSKNIMLGLVNPKKNNRSPGDDGLAKCIEVWFDEMRISGTNDQAGYAAAGKVSVQLADLGNVNLSGSMHTPGYGNIDQKIQQRFQDQYYQYNTSTNIALGKLLPRNLGVQLPLFVGYTQNVSTPKYNPFDQDVLLTHELSTAKNERARDSIREAAQDFTSITSANITNARIQGNPTKASNNRMPWSIKNFDFTYAYNNQLKRNPVLEMDKLTTQRYGLGYSYSLKSRPVEPFKAAIKSKSKWLALVKDFNFNPVPSTFNMRNDLNRVTQETQIRNIDDGSGYKIQPTFFKNFTWNRTYALRWEIMKSVSLDYNATNISRIDEPYGRINTKLKRDTLFDNIRRLGRNNSYNQTFNGTYNVPTSKLPLTDWTSARLGYSANYSWTTAPPIAYAQGNTIGNTQTKTVTGEFNMTQLYNKSRWLKALNGKPRKAGESRRGDVAKPGESRTAPTDLRKSSDLKKAGMKSGDKSMPDMEPDVPEETIDPKEDKKKDKKKKDEEDTTKAPETPLEIVKAAYPRLNTANLTDEQLDSLVQVQKDLDRAKALAEKKKKKADKKAARKARRNRPLQLSPVEHVIGHTLTMLNRVTVNYTETQGTILPGYMDSTRFMGVNNYSAAPGFNFVYGYQPDYAWLSSQANAGRLSRDSLFNAQFQQTYSRNLNAQATLLPHKSFRVDLTLTQTFSKSHSELYADTSIGRNGPFEHHTPYQTGSFNISYITVNSMFKNSGVNSEIYNTFLSNRLIVSKRLGASNPYTNGLPDPYNPNYSKGYGPFSQDVLIPSFIAAYSGNSAHSSPLIDYKHDRLKENPFKYFIPMPNWRVTYNGLSKLPVFSKLMTSFIVNHAYTGTMGMNSFNSSLLFGDLYGLGFPSFIDSNSNNYIPYYQVPNVTITQAFNPLIGFDAAFKNNVTAKFEVRKSKTQSLSLIDYQVGENASTEYVIGGGFRKKGVRLPFPLFGVRRLKNELIFKLDIGLRDDKTSNTFLANNVSVTSRGQKVIRISPTVNYAVNDLLTLLFFFDRQQTIPYVSNAFPTTTTRAGVTLRFVFAQ